MTKPTFTKSRSRSVVSRRQFFALTAQAAGKSCLVLSLPAILAACDRAQEVRSGNAALRVLTADEFAALDAISARLVPTDSTPGAREAGVVYFMDTVLADDRDTELQAMRAGLSELQEQVASSYGGADFQSLSAADQDAMLRQIENGQFFGLVRYLTIAGLFALPEYGGNGPDVGYEIIGFDNRHAWAPPFGAYDVDANGGEQ